MEYYLAIIKFQFAVGYDTETDYRLIKALTREAAYDKLVSEYGHNYYYSINVTATIISE